MAGKIAVTYGEESWELGAKAGMERHKPGSNAIKGLFDGAQNFLDFLGPKIQDMCNSQEKKSTAATVNITWPKLTLGGEIKTIEKPTTSDVGISGKISLGFQPFIGANVKVELLTWLLERLQNSPAPQAIIIAVILQKAKKAMEDGIVVGGVRTEVDLGITLTLEGTANGSIDINYNDLGDLDKVKATVENKLVLKLKAFANVKADAETPFFDFVAHIGVEGEAETGCGVKLKAAKKR